MPTAQTWTLRGWASHDVEGPSRLRARWLVDEVVLCDSAAPAADGTTTCAFPTGEAGEREIRLEVSDSAGRAASATTTVTVATAASDIPTCVITAPGDGGASVEGAAVELAAFLGDVGADGLAHPERLTIAWSSDKQGLLGTSVPGTDGSVVFTTSALWGGTHELMLRATDAEGNTCADAITWSVGTPPSVTITDPLDGDVHDEGSPALLAGLVEDPEDLPGELWVRWESDRDGVLAEGPPDDNGETALYTAALTRGVHVVSLTVADPLGLESTAWVTVRVNGAPTAPTVTLSPTAPTTDDALVASLSAPSVDPDGDALTYTYAWSRFGVPATECTSDTFPASTTSRGDVWTVDVSASDGRMSSPVGSASVTIGNSAPVVDAVSLSPATLFTGDEATAVSGASDPDGDPLTFTYDWYVDAALVQSGGMDALSGVVHFDRGQTVWVTVTASDGATSDSATSAPIVVGNTPPTPPDVHIEPGAPEAGDPLTCMASISDPDGDRVTYTFTWDVDGVGYTGATDGTASSTVDGADVLNGQVWTCTVVADDGLESSEPGVVSVIVGSLFPATCQEIRDAQPTAGDGDYTLYVENDASRPWSVYCHDMEGTPIAYLPLVEVGWPQNSSYYPCNGATYGTDVYTSFTRVRIDPVTFDVDGGDFTFSTSTGDCHTFDDLTEVAWGYAGTCNASADGRAYLDLTGTPFIFEPAAFDLEGYRPSGTATYSPDSTVVTLTGGGYCGSMSSSDPDSTVNLTYSP